MRLGAAQVLEALAGHPGHAVLPMDMAQVLEFGALPGVRDPMDRMVAAAARALGAALVSVDEALGGQDLARV